MPSFFTSLATAGFLLLGTSSLVSATPAPDRVQVRQDGVAGFPVAATLAAQMLPEVDPTFKADLEANVVINLDQPLAKSKSRRSRRDWYGPWDDESAVEEARDTATSRERRESQLDGESRRAPQSGGGADPDIPGEPQASTGRRAPQSGGGADPIHPSVDGRQAATGSVCNIEGYVLMSPPPSSLLSPCYQARLRAEKEKRKLTNLREPDMPSWINN